MPKSNIKQFHKLADAQFKLPHESRGRIGWRHLPEPYAQLMDHWVEAENAAAGKNKYNRHDALAVALRHGIDAMFLRVEALEGIQEAQRAAQAAAEGTELTVN